MSHDDPIDLKPEDVIENSADLPVVTGHPDSERNENVTPPMSAVPSSKSPKLGSYTLVARFRSSEQAFVFLGYKTTNLGLSRPSVLKFVPRVSREYLYQREHLMDEVRAMLMLNHPNIVAVEDAVENAQGFFVALEYVEGLDAGLLLNILAKQRQRLPFEVSCYIVTELLRALESAHTAKGPDGQPLQLIHRDVNPTNVLLSRHGRVKLTDFGVVKMRGRIAGETLPGFVKGKLHYLPPEYLKDDHIDHRADVYSASILFFELLTGTQCFPSTRRAETFTAIFSGVDLDRLRTASVPEGLIAIVARASDRELQKRFSTAAQFRSTVESWLAEKGRYVSSTSLAAFIEQWMHAK
jgi:eukaryotic-like serine/threonine-protein kinase